MKNLCILIFTCILYGQISSQDVSSFGLKNNYKLSGHINAGLNFYKYSGEGSDRYAPYGYMISGGVNARLGAINVPVAFSYNQLNGSISSPFNLYGASPYYKWVKLHLGHRSINFSPYTYSGKSFFGAGIELNPGKFHLTAFKGKMRNPYAIRDTIVGGGVELPTFNRNVSAVKIGFGSRENKFELMGVKIRDDQTSNGEVNEFDPVDNFLLGSSLSLRAFKKITFNLNTSISLFTGNQNSDESAQLSSLESSFEFLHDPNYTTRASFAGDASIEYNNKGYQIGAEYKRINPYYYSLGINYLQNDIENYTLQLGAPLLKRRLRLRGSIGLQNDNLSNQKAYTSKRLIGSLIATYFPSQDFNMMARYGNYQHSNESGLVEINDTIRILTTTHNINLSTQWNIIKTDEKTIRLSLNLFQNKVIDESAIGDRDGNFSGKGIIGKLMYDMTPLGLSFGPTFNYNDYSFSTFSQGRAGGGIYIRKTLLDNRLTGAINYLYNQNIFDGKSNGSLQSYNLNIRYQMAKKHNLHFRTSYIKNQNTINNSFNELRGNMGYGFTF